MARVFAGAMVLATLGIARNAITALIEKRFAGRAFRAEPVGGRFAFCTRLQRADGRIGLKLRW